MVNDNYILIQVWFKLLISVTNIAFCDLLLILVLKFKEAFVNFYYIYIVRVLADLKSALKTWSIER